MGWGDFMERENHKQNVLETYDNFESLNTRNRMGCSEDWYNPYFAISRTFEKNEVEKMDSDTIELLVKLASNMSDALY